MLHRIRALTACLIALLAAAPPVLAREADALQIHPFAEPIRYSHHNDDFTVRVRIPGGEWRDLYEYTVKVDLDTKQEASMVYFNFDGVVEMSVQKNSGAFAKVAVRPSARAIQTSVRNNTVYFTLKRPENLSVEFDNDKLHNLHVFTHAIRKDMPPVADGLRSEQIGTGVMPDLTQNVVFFGPGIHAGEFRLRSDTTVYIHGAAMLKNPLIIDGVQNVRIISDGLFEGVAQTKIRHSKNIVIDGPIFINQPGGTMTCLASQDIEERSIRTIGGGQWSDGLGHFACERVKIVDSFIRTSDDCVTVYNHRWDIWGSSRDIQVSRSTLWADIAHAMMIGMHGNTPSAAHPDAEIIERIRFSDIDVLEHDEDDPEYEGVIGLMAGDDNLVRDIVFEDIRVEHIQEGKLFNLHIAYTPKYNTSPGRGIDKITLRNISYTGQGSPSASVIYGYAAARMVTDVTLENVTVAGKRITGPERGVLDVGPFAAGVIYR